MAEVVRKNRDLIEKAEQQLATADKKETEELRRLKQEKKIQEVLKRPRRGHDSDIDADLLDGMHADEIIRKGRMGGGGPDWEFQKSAFEKPFMFIIHKNDDTLKYEAIYGTQSNRAGKIYGTPNADPTTIINDVLVNGLTTGRSHYEKVILNGYFSGLGKLTPKSYTDLVFDGKFLWKTDLTSEYLTTDGQSNIILEGNGIIDGTGDITSQLTAFLLKNSSWINVRKLKFQNSRREMVQLENITDSIINGLFGENLEVCLVWVKDNNQRILVDNIVSKGHSLSEAIAVVPWTTNAINYDITVSNCILSEIKRDGIIVGTFNGLNNQVRRVGLYNNKIIHAAIGGEGYGGIGFRGSSGMGSLSDIEAKGNQIFNSAADGYYITAADRLTIEGGCVVLSQMNGMMIWGVRNGKIIGVDIINSGQLTNNTYDGIRLRSSTTENNKIQFNRILSTSDVANKMARGIMEWSDVVPNEQTYEFNEISGQIGNAILLYPNSRSIHRFNKGWNPLGKWSQSWDNTNYLLNRTSGSATPVTGQFYTVIGTKVWINYYGGADVNVTIEDPYGNNLLYGDTTYNRFWLERAWKISWGWTSAPTIVTVWD